MQHCDYGLATEDEDSGYHTARLSPKRSVNLVWHIIYIGFVDPIMLIQGEGSGGIVVGFS